MPEGREEVDSDQWIEKAGYWALTTIHLKYDIVETFICDLSTISYLVPQRAWRGNSSVYFFHIPYTPFTPWCEYSNEPFF